MAAKSPKRKRKEAGVAKVDTKAETFRIYKEGNTVAEIAKQRNLSIQTIEGHLAYFVQQGLISIDDLVAKHKIVIIESEVKNFDGGSITSIKERLGKNISFGEIRLVLAWVEHQKSSAHINH